MTAHQGGTALLLGIDFGTTRTVVATCDRGNYPVVSFADDAGDTTDWYPSIVAERDGELRFGLDAAGVAAEPGWSALRSFKRLLSEPGAGPESSVRVGSTTLRLPELLERFLGALRDDLARRSNAPRRKRASPELRCVVATPANAHSTQRFLTLEAFRQAGFEVIALVNEPSAAGFEYAHRYRETLTSRREHVLVYDLGGGTFDASLVRMTGKHHDVLATSGVARLGGDDFDEMLARLAVDAAGIERREVPEACWKRLLEQCRLAKETLGPSSRRVAIDLVDCLGPDAPVPETSVAAAALYEACTPLVERTVDAMVPVLERLERAVRAESGAPCDAASLADVAGVYVVGGASALPVVGRILRARFGRRVHRSPYPSAATAIGLAIAAQGASGLRLADRLAHTFGVFREEGEGASVCFDPILTGDVRVPVPGDAPTVVERTYRAAHNVGHFRFVECSRVDDAGAPAGDITPFAELHFAFDAALRGAGVDLSGVAVQRTAEPGPLVRERYEIDAAGIVQVTITDLDTGHARAHRLGR
jgi:molecular chaperone DnaK (HSP70)